MHSKMQINTFSPHNKLCSSWNNQQCLLSPSHSSHCNCYYLLHSLCIGYQLFSSKLKPALLQSKTRKYTAYDKGICNILYPLFAKHPLYSNPLHELLRLLQVKYNTKHNSPMEAAVTL